MRAESRQELRNALEKRLDGTIPDDIWSKFQPVSDPPYDNADAQEIVQDLAIANVSVAREEKHDDHVSASRVRTEVALRELAPQIRDDRRHFFGSSEPPFSNRDEMVDWIRKEAKDRQLPAKEEVDEKDLYYPCSDGWARYVTVHEGTLLYNLWKCVRWRAGNLRCNDAQALAHILIGEFPSAAPIEWSYSPPSRKEYPSLNPYLGEVTITIREPVNEDDLVALYRALRESVWGHKRDRQPPSERDAELVKSVIGWTRGRRNGSEPKSWELMRRGWNRKFPNWKYDYYQGFFKAFNDSYKKIYPGVEWSGKDPWKLRRM